MLGKEIYSHTVCKHFKDILISEGTVMGGMIEILYLIQRLKIHE